MEPSAVSRIGDYGFSKCLAWNCASVNANSSGPALSLDDGNPFLEFCRLDGGPLTRGTGSYANQVILVSAHRDIPTVFRKVSCIFRV